MGRGLAYRSAVAFIMMCLLCRGADCFAQLTAVQENGDTELIFDSRLGSHDPSERQNAIEKLRENGAASPSALADALPQWLPVLLRAKEYSAVVELTTAAIKAKPYVMPVVYAAENGKVQALLRMDNPDLALPQAKAFYDSCSLEETSGAIDLLAEALTRAKGADVAGRFRAEQMSGGPDLNNTATQPAGNELTDIVVDSDYASQIQSFHDNQTIGGSYKNLVTWGNLLLLSDRSTEAKKCFLSACHSPKSPRQFREAVEGVARAIRAECGNVAPADAFIRALQSSRLPDERNTPEATTLFETPGLELEKLRLGAQQTVLANLVAFVPPPLEEDRKAAESNSGADSGIKLEVNIEGAPNEVIQQISANHFRVILRSAIPDWFIVHVSGASQKLTRIDINYPAGGIGNWSTENPVYSYATRLDDVTAFIPKNEVPTGRRQGWNNTVLPYANGETWQFIENVWLSDRNTLSMVQKFEQDSAFVAMRVPYPVTYNENYFATIKSNPLVVVHEIGKSKQNHPLFLAQIGSQRGQGEQLCILIYAGEHADEPDAMWAAHGAIDFLLSDKGEPYRSKYTFLIIPQLDPDASYHGDHAGIITSFSAPYPITRESMAYANWFEKWMLDGHRLDITFDLHNVQSRESPHIACALAEGLGDRGTLAAALNDSIIAAADSTGLAATASPWNRGYSPDRLAGWLATYFGPVPLAYEINSQAPEAHLTLAQCKSIGSTLIEGADSFFGSRQGSTLMGDVDDWRKAWSAGAAGSVGIHSNDAIVTEANRGSKIPIGPEKVLP